MKIEIPEENKSARGVELLPLWGIRYADSAMTGLTSACAILLLWWSACMLGFDAASLSVIAWTLVGVVGVVAALSAYGVLAPRFEGGLFLPARVRKSMLAVVGLTALIGLGWSAVGGFAGTKQMTQETASPAPMSPAVEQERLLARIALLTAYKQRLEGDKQRLEGRILWLQTELAKRPVAGSPSSENAQVVAMLEVVRRSMEPRTGSPSSERAVNEGGSAPGAPPAGNSPAPSGEVPPRSKYEGPELAPATIEAIKKNPALLSDLLPFFPFLPLPIQAIILSSLFPDRTVIERVALPTAQNAAGLPSESEIRQVIESARDPGAAREILSAMARERARQVRVPADALQTFEAALELQMRTALASADATRRDFPQTIAVLSADVPCDAGRREKILQSLGGRNSDTVIRRLRQITSDACLDEIGATR